MGNRNTETPAVGTTVVVVLMGALVDVLTLATRIGNTLDRMTDGFLPFARMTMRTLHLPFLCTFSRVPDRRQLPEMVHVRFPFAEVLTSEARRSVVAGVSVDFFHANIFVVRAASAGLRGMHVARVTNATSVSTRRGLIGHLPSNTGIVVNSLVTVPRDEKNSPEVLIDVCLQGLYRLV